MAVPGREPTEHSDRESNRPYEETNRPYAEPNRPYEARPTSAVRPGPVGYFDALSWGSVFAGVFTALAIMMMLSFFGVAVGLTTVSVGGVTNIVASAIWSVVSLLIGLFFGGWLAAATSGPTGTWDGIYHGIVVWGLSMILIAVAGGFGLGGLFGAFLVIDTGILAAAFWGYFFASLFGLVAAIIGGIAGSGRETYRA